MATQTTAQKAMAQKAAKELGVTIPTETTTTPTAPVTSSNTSQDAFSKALESKILAQSEIVSSLDTGVEQTYADAIKNLEGAASANTERVTSEFDRQIGYRQTTGGYQTTQEVEARRGFATSRTALMALDTEIQKDIKDLEQRKQELILTGESEVASQISQLMIDKLKFKADAQQKYFNNLLGMGSFAQGQAQIAENKRQFNENQILDTKKFEEDKRQFGETYALQQQQAALDVKQFEEGKRQFEQTYGFNLLRFNADEKQRGFENKMAEKQLSLNWAEYGLKKLYNEAQIREMDRAATTTFDAEGMKLKRMGSDGGVAVFVPKQNMTDKEIDSVGEIKNGIEVINKAQELYESAVATEGPQIPGKKGIVSAITNSGFYATSIKGNMRAAAAVTGISAEWKAYRDFLIANKANIAKGIGGETGALAAQEQVDAMLRLNAMGDKPEFARAKFDNSRQQMSTRLQSYGTLKDANMSTSNGPSDGLSTDAAWELYQKTINGG
jgi:hypothetical protein